MRAQNGPGPLRQVLEQAATEHGYSMRELTVLSPQRDPYRLDTPSGHRDGAWFAQMVERFLGPVARIHLRGFHYRISSAADVLRPGNGLPYTLPYTNTDENWEWLQEDAAKAGRWLKYVPFERIVDERNAPAEIYVPEVAEPSLYLSVGDHIKLPLLVEDALPRFGVTDVSARQPYRIILIGEKVSLREILLPIVSIVRGELLLPTGEISDTMLAELVARAAADGRPAVVLYFHDFDPSGRQMAVSVSRKLQALRDLLHPDPDLDIRLYPVALTLEQVRRLRLPSTPLKEEEKRADKWRAAMGHEQTEIDALIAINPNALREIAEDAIRPFYDDTLEARVERAQQQWRQEAAERLEAHPAYQTARVEIEAALERVNEAVAEFHAAQSDAVNALQDEVIPPDLELPEADITEEAGAPLFSTDDDFATASRKLIAYKALEIP